MYLLQKDEGHGKRTNVEDRECGRREREKGAGSKGARGKGYLCGGGLGTKTLSQDRKEEDMAHRLKVVYKGTRGTPVLG